MRRGMALLHHTREQARPAPGADALCMVQNSEASPLGGPTSAPQQSQISLPGRRLHEVGDCVIALAPHIPGFAQNPRSAGELNAWDFAVALSWMARWLASVSARSQDAVSGPAADCCATNRRLCDPLQFLLGGLLPATLGAAWAPSAFLARGSRWEIGPGFGVFGPV